MTRRAGFTLIELVVVIMILGILAGIAAPKMFNTSNSAKDNGLKQTLAIVRDAIELYNAKYGALPTAGTGGATLKTSLAPEFVRKFPTSPLTGTDTIKVVTGTTPAADGTTAWVYNGDTGEFLCNSTASSGGTPYAQF